MSMITPMSNDTQTRINGQTLNEARRLYEQAESSEVQAAIYSEMAQAIRSLDSDWSDADVYNDMVGFEIQRLEDLADEMYADADYNRGQIEQEWIDHL